MRKLTKNILVSVTFVAIWTGLFMKYSKGETINRFDNYREKAKYSWHEFSDIEQGKKIGAVYDLDGDMKPDCAEFYDIMIGPFGHMYKSDNPNMYWFDNFPNNKIEIHELYNDASADGLNGNEVQQKYKLENLI